MVYAAAVYPEHTPALGVVTSGKIVGHKGVAVGMYQTGNLGLHTVGTDDVIGMTHGGKRRHGKVTVGIGHPIVAGSHGQCPHYQTKRNPYKLQSNLLN